jgi:hypothetical protein
MPNDFRPGQGSLRRCLPRMIRSRGVHLVGFDFARGSRFAPWGRAGSGPVDTARSVRWWSRPLRVRSGDQRRLRAFRTNPRPRQLFAPSPSVAPPDRLIGGTSLVFPYAMGDFTNTSLFCRSCVFPICTLCLNVKPESRRFWFRASGGNQVGIRELYPGDESRMAIGPRHRRPPWGPSPV